MLKSDCFLSSQVLPHPHLPGGAGGERGSERHGRPGVQGHRSPHPETRVVQGREGVADWGLLRAEGREQQADHDLQMRGHQLRGVGHERDGAQDQEGRESGEFCFRPAKT